MRVLRGAGHVPIPEKIPESDGTRGGTDGLLQQPGVMLHFHSAQALQFSDGYQGSLGLATAADGNRLAAICGTLEQIRKAALGFGNGDYRHWRNPLEKIILVLIAIIVYLCG